MLDKRPIASAALILPAVLALLSACGGDRSGSEHASAEAADSEAAAAGNTVVQVQMTGLLLVAAPKQRGQPTHIILPEAIDHVAWLGFGADSSSLCEHWDDGICYVDLEKFSVDSLGGNAQPTTAEIASFPSGLMNLTAAPGAHKLNLATHAQPSVVLLAGRFLTDTTCRLGRWSYTLGGQSKEEELANLLTWQFVLPSTGNLTLVFRDSTGAPQPPVPLVATRDTVKLLLLNVPNNERNDLPPAPQDTVDFPSGQTAAHFNVFYHLIASPIPDRVIPTLRARARRESCLVEITTDFSGMLPPSGGLKTHACMPAAVEVH